MNLIVVSHSHNSIRVRWNPPLYANGVLIGYRILVTNVDTGDTVFNEPFPAYSRQTIIQSGICELSI